jgi:ribosome-binding protein aMBF1 (putative translation factor)
MQRLRTDAECRNVPVCRSRNEPPFTFLETTRAAGRRKKKILGADAPVEACRLQLGMDKKELAAELRTSDDAVRACMSGRTVGRAETVAKIKGFLKKRGSRPV